MEIDPTIALGVAGFAVALLGAAGGFYAIRARRLTGESPPELDVGEDQIDVADPTSEAPSPGGLADLFRTALGRTRETLSGGLGVIFGRGVDEQLFEDLELALLTADVAISTTERLLAPLRELAKKGEQDSEALQAALRGEMRAVLAAVDKPLEPTDGHSPHVVLVVGVNGSGKTTTIGKLSHRYASEGKRVLLGAAAPFRAAAGEQLGVWAERSGADIVAHQEGADPGAVAYDTLAKAKAKGHDVVIIDTAGRLQTKGPLMEQLTKIRKVIGKQLPDAPHETLLVVDGTIGQNALSQAKLFNEATPLTGVAITKLDGTAKGGMVLTIASELRLPVKLVGIGEQMEDLKDFDGEAFVDAIM